MMGSVLEVGICYSEVGLVRSVAGHVQYVL